MRVIDDKTAVSIGLLAVLGGGVVWLTSLYSMASNTAERVDKIEKKQDAYLSEIIKIREDVAVIKQMLKKSKD